jgi:Leucine-rich repeat (LRR) protein
VQRLLAQRPPKLQPFVVKRLQELLPLSQSRLDLDLSRMDLGNLDFLKGCQIARLDLSGNPVADLSPLIGSGVQILNVAGTKITSLEQIAQLPVVVLDCSSTQVTSLQPLRGSSVVDLNIAGTKIEDLTPISNLPLRRLRADRTPIRDTKALTHQKKLQYLSLAGCQGVSLVGLPTYLEELDISYLTGCDLRVVEPLFRLRKLSLVGVDCKDCPFHKLSGLESLDLSATGISNLEGLVALPLRHLRLARTKVTERDLEALASSDILESLDLSGTSITNLAVLGGKKKLLRLNLAQTKIQSLAFASQMQLEHLDISGTAISDLSDLRGVSLRSIVLSQCPVQDCSPLAQARLVRLDAAQTALEDLSPLQGQPLVRLDVHGTRVQNLGDVSGGAMQLLDGVGCALFEGNFDRTGMGFRLHCDPELAKGVFLESVRRQRVKGIGMSQGLAAMLSNPEALSESLRARGWMAIPKSCLASEASLEATRVKAAVLSLQDPAQARRLSTDLAGARVWVRIGREDVFASSVRDPEVLTQVSWSTWSPETLVILCEGRWRLPLPAERAMVLIEGR